MRRSLALLLVIMVLLHSINTPAWAQKLPPPGDDSPPPSSGPAEDPAPAPTKPPPPPAGDDSPPGSDGSSGQPPPGTKPPPPPLPTKPPPPPLPTKPPPPPLPTKPPPPPLPTKPPPQPTAPSPTAGSGATSRRTATASWTPTATASPTTTTPRPVPTISGIVFNDEDGDGSLGSGEAGVAGVPVVVDGRVVTATGAGGRFSLALPPKGRVSLAVVPPEGWEWRGEPLVIEETAQPDGLSIPLRRQTEVAAQSTPISSLLLAGMLFLAGAVAFAALVLLSLRAMWHSFERTFRRLKTEELELAMAQELLDRRKELGDQLAAKPEAWRGIIAQLLADAGTPDQVAEAGVVTLSDSPAPHFAVAGQSSREYVFTTSPDALRRVGLLQRRVLPIPFGRQESVKPLDAALFPTARVEVLAVWEHLAAEFMRDPLPMLPRQGEWWLGIKESQR